MDSAPIIAQLKKSRTKKEKQKFHQTKIEIKLINEVSYLLIQASFNNPLQTLQFENKFPLETIKKNPFFSYFESIDEILEELFSFIENKKYNLIEENKEISLIFQLPVHKVKEIKFSLKQKEKSDNEKINELYNIIGNLKKENSLLKEENNILKKRLDNNDNLIKELISRLENNENKIKILEDKEKERERERERKIELGLIGLISKIIKSYNDIAFVNERLTKNEVFRNKKLKYNLLYRASRDGDNSNKFHEKCDNINNIIAIFKTKEGRVFGGYTEKGYKGNNQGNTIDNNAFFFSCNLKKIYNVKRNKTAIYDENNCGPIFGANTTIINVYHKMFDCNCCTCSISDSCFEGLNSDYEINNGKSNFYLQEIEVFQVLVQ